MFHFTKKCSCATFVSLLTVSCEFANKQRYWIERIEKEKKYLGFFMDYSTSNFGESGSRLEVRPQGDFQTSDKFDNGNHKSCSHGSWFLAWLELSRISKFWHMLQILTHISTFFGLNASLFHLNYKWDKLICNTHLKCNWHQNT